MENNNLDELKFICDNCIKEVYLASLVSTNGFKRKCSYCYNESNCFEIDNIADHIDEAFSHNYRRTADQPDDYQIALMKDRESNYDWERDGAPIIDAIIDAAQIPYKAAEDIQQILSDRYSDRESALMGKETEYSDDSYYEGREPNCELWNHTWRLLENKIKNENRFFNLFASDTLENIFKNIESIKTEDGSSIITTIGPESAIPVLYRARFFQEDEQLFEALKRPDIFLGPPPNKIATGGRMNAFGISVFYGADIKDVAIAEVRPPVGCKVIASKFDILRPLNLFDMTLLDKIKLSGSIFDPSYNAFQEKVAFLKNLCKKNIIPVMPDNENIDYLVTQLISDYLSSLKSPTLDGIIYPSVQVSNGKYFVLFNKSSRIINLPIPHSTKITAHRWQDEDGEEEYHISDIDLRNDSDVKNDINYPTIGEVLGEIVDQDFKDSRQPSLKTSYSDLIVYTIESVSFGKTKHNVSYSHLDNKEDTVL